MTSKFAPLTKLKKQELEEVRRKLLSQNNEIKKLESELVTAQNTLEEQQIPNGGSIALLSQFKTLVQACHDEVIRKKNVIYYAMEKRKQIEKELNQAHIEYEKFNYLQTEEEKAHMKKLKKLEELQLDEVAIMGYNAKNNN